MQTDKHQPLRAKVRKWTERQLNPGRGDNGGNGNHQFKALVDEPGGVWSGLENPNL